MRLIKLTRVKPIGDTIVEVMIVLAVLGLAISIAYATANRSLLNARQAQESAEASSLAQDQVEQLRAYSVGDKLDIFNAFPFCIQSGASPQIVNIDTAPDGCGGANSGLNGFDARYAVKITQSTDNTDTFTVSVKWADILGDGNDSATLIYRVHKP
jgi:Tfp pilus assembly protein PilE